MKAAVPYRLDIQGLRAIAVLAVVLFHASGGAWLKGGFVGVDVFFVISGFLITGILLSDIENRRFSIAQFYRRRIRRLFPALATVLVFVLAVGAVLLTPLEYAELAKTAVGTLLFVSNIIFLHYSNYFDGPSELKPLLHTWSLAVEEQFYILFPLLLFVLSKLSRQWMAPAFLAGWLLSFAVNLWWSRAHPSAAFYLAPTRAFELLTGAFLASHPHLTARLGPRAKDALSLAGLALIAGSVLLIRDTMPFPGYAALGPVFGTALVIAAGRDRPSLGGRLISSAPFVFFGNISYSLYLWHWPLLVYARHANLGPLKPLTAAAIALTSVALAYASWRWIERPFIRGGPKLPVLSIGAGVVAVGSLLCGVIVAAHGFPQRFSPTALAAFSAAEDYSPKRQACHDGGGPSFAYQRNCVLGAGSNPIVAVWADSHGVELAFELGQRLAPSGGGVIQITSSSCPPAMGFVPPDRPHCKGHNADTLEALARDARIREVWLLANLSAYPPKDRPALLAGLAESTRRLRAAGKAVLLFEPIPVFDYEAPTAVGMTELWGGAPAAWGLKRADYDRTNSQAIGALQRLAAETGARIVDTPAVLCNRALCPAFRPQTGVLYFNSNHLDLAGARLLLDAAVASSQVIPGGPGSPGSRNR